MNRIITGFICFALFISVNSQIVQLTINEPNMSTDLNNLTIDAEGLPSDFEIEEVLWVVNNNSQALTLQCKKTEINVLSGTENITCWVICPAIYDLAGANPIAFVTVGGNVMTETIGAGDTIKTFSAHYKPMNLDGCSLLKYEWYDENDLMTPLANISIRFLHTTGPCSLSINESIENDNINIYPNPADDYMRIELEGNILLSNSAKLSIYDIIGKEVFSINASALLSGNVELKTDQFKQGVYIVCLSENDRSIITKRLVINH